MDEKLIDQDGDYLIYFSKKENLYEIIKDVNGTWEYSEESRIALIKTHGTGVKNEWHVHFDWAMNGEVIVRQIKRVLHIIENKL